MAESLLVAGIVCIVASIVGGGIKLLGAEVPVLNSFARQAMLFAVGAAFLFGSFWSSQTKPSPPANVVATGGGGTAPTQPTQPAACPEAAALGCLPRSSGPVTFQNPAAANLAAWANVRDGNSTTQAQAAAESAGASGKAARLCGIVGSDDSSPLGKHNAAVRLNNLVDGDGQATAACLKMASSFL